MNRETVLIDDSVEMDNSASFKLSPGNVRPFALGMLDLYFDAVKSIRLQNREQVIILAKTKTKGKDEFEVQGTKVTLFLGNKTLTYLLQISTAVALGRKFGANHMDFDFYAGSGMEPFGLVVKLSDDLYEWNREASRLSDELTAFAEKRDAEKRTS